MALKSTAELSIRQNKMQEITNDIESLDRQINEQDEDLKKKQVMIKGLEQEIKELKDDIRNEDVKIAERENNIQKLKKKTHELSQFKFVLDFKIRDLREDITPRQIETEKLRLETNAKDQELRQYNNLNAKLGFIVEKLRNQ
jgi:chromosome segregation ATPase